MVEQDLADTNETLSDQTCANQSIQGAKMKIESEMGTYPIVFILFRKIHSLIEI